MKIKVVYTEFVRTPVPSVAGYVAMDRERIVEDEDELDRFVSKVIAAAGIIHSIEVVAE